MKRFERKITLLLIFGIALCEIHTVCKYFYPVFFSKMADRWWSKDYHELISLEYYMFEIENFLVLIIWFLTLGSVVKLVSYRLFKIMMVFVLSFISQLVLYTYNRNTSFHSNIIVYLYLVVAVIFYFIPAKKGGKLINLEDYDF